MNNRDAISRAFAKNRTEELSSDVWEQFVIPRFIKSVDLLTARKPRIVVGGRGCGKTMLLKYFAYQTQFSKKRQTIPLEATKDIGLYLRVDTQFANIMSGRGLDDDVWLDAFDGYLALSIGIRVLDAVQTLSNANLDPKVRENLNSISFKRIQGFDNELPSSLNGLMEELERRYNRFELWVSNAGKIEAPLFFPSRSFLNELIKDIRTSCKDLKDVVFHVFLDEFENLRKLQQQVVNSRIKHSEAPLIFSVAMKRRGFVTTQTTGPESISDIADYRQIDLEQLLLDADFSLFAGEIFLLHMSTVNGVNLPIHPATLRQEGHLAERNNTEYKKKVRDFVSGILPSMSHKEIAIRILKEPRLVRKLKNSLDKGLREHKASLSAEDFITDGFPMESVVCCALVNRQRSTPKSILKEFEKLKEGQPSKFPDWVHNNFVGCALLLYDSHDKVCPIYTGFDTFTTLAKGNLRHFLELCYKSLDAADSQIKDGILCISPDTQAWAARQTSAAFLREIRTAGHMGNRLHSFVLSLGSLFALAHRRISQSEPEQNHFSTSGLGPLKKELCEFLDQAIRWNVLFEEEETKKKEAIDQHQATFEYVLNPIYAPYFNISYRKRRRLKLSAEDFACLVEGEYENVRRLLKKYSNSWKIDVSESEPTLFSHLSDRGDT